MSEWIYQYIRAQRAEQILHLTTALTQLAKCQVPEIYNAVKMRLRSTIQQEAAETGILIDMGCA